MIITQCKTTIKYFQTLETIAMVFIDVYSMLCHISAVFPWKYFTMNNSLPFSTTQNLHTVLSRVCKNTTCVFSTSKPNAHGDPNFIIFRDRRKLNNTFRSTAFCFQTSFLLGNKCFRHFQCVNIFLRWFYTCDLRSGWVRTELMYCIAVFTTSDSFPLTRFSPVYSNIYIYRIY